MSDIGSAAGELHAAWLILRERWEAARERWRDPVQERFAREFWEEFERLVPAALVEMRHLDETLDQALSST